MAEHTGPWHYRGLLMALIASALILCVRLGYYYMGDPMHFPINTVKISANFQRIPRQQLADILEKYQKNSYFSIPIHQLEEQLNGLDWADEARVSRLWPDTLKIHLVEKKPMAIWNHSLVTEDGRLFSAEPTRETSALTQLEGPEPQKNEILQIYKKLSKLLVKSGLYVALLQIHDNQSLDLTLTNGVQLRLGKQEIESRNLH